MKQARKLEQLQDYLIDFGWAPASANSISERISRRDGAPAEMIAILRETKEVEECSPGSRQAVGN